MAGNNWNVTGDNLPKDSGNRYMQAWYDPVNNAFALPYGYPVSGSAGALAIGHMTNYVLDTLPSGSARSNGVDLGGYPLRGMMVPAMGGGTWNLEASASGVAYALITDQNGSITNVTYTANAAAYALSQSALLHAAPYRLIRINPAVAQTAARTFMWVLST